MPPRPTFSESELAMIISAICFFKAEGERAGEKRYPVYQRVSECLGVSLSSVKRAAKKDKENEDEGNPNQAKKNDTSTGRPKIDIDQFTIGVIRRTIYNFFIEKTFPTIEKLKSKLEDIIPDLPSMSQTKLRQIVNSIGFRFKKLNRKPVLMESVRIAASRHAYLRRIRRLRENGYEIFYTDETWCGQNHTMKYAWQENIVEALNQHNNYDQYRNHLQEVFGWRGGFKTPSGSGQRVIILHIGSERGFLKGAQLCFVGKKGTGDYHKEMNAQHFEEWFRKVLTILPPKSAVVIDQAPYHTMVDPETKNPTMSWLKGDIISWIVNKNIPLPPDATEFVKLTKSVLINHARPYFRTPEKRLDQLTKELRPDVELIWLPVAHCELNAIELIWAYVKNKIAKVNRSNAEEKGNSVNVTRDLCEETLQTVTPELWAKCVKHAIKVEDHYWEKDHLCDEIPLVQPIIVDLHSSDSESDDDNVELYEDFSDCD